MTVPLWSLLGFAAWTLILLIATIGVHRWNAILRGRAGLADFPADRPHGAQWYQRAMRAHANCVENLPVFAAIVAVATAAGVDTPVLDVCAAIVPPARIAQSCVHVATAQTHRVVAIRFGFFAVQIACMLAMIVAIVLHVRV